MPRQKDLKRLVRARMRKTGEAYTAARAQILRKSRSKPASTTARDAAPRPSTPTTPKPDEYAKLAGMSDDAIRAQTGRTWQEWTETLDAENAAAMPHRDIASMMHTKYAVRAWWSQAVTVGYERIKGLRARGQRRDGSYEANKSRTYNVPVATLFDAWNDASTRRRWLDTPGVKVRTAKANKSMRIGWPDGAIISLWFESKGQSKSVVAVQHTKLPDKETANRLKEYWAERLQVLDDVLTRR